MIPERSGTFRRRGRSRAVGHTHGGQVGLLSLGLPWTFLRLFGDKIPDHGFWARGTDRMYIHRDRSLRLPLRLGVPAEESLVRVHRA